MGQLGQTDFKVSLVSKEQVVHLDCPVILAYPDLLDLLVMEEHQALLGKLVLQDLVDRLDHKDRKVIRDLPDPKDHQVAVVQLVLQVQ